MVNFWPKMYEDELLISILKRYHVRTANSNNGTTLAELFGTYYISIHTHMPTNLNTLISNLPSVFNSNCDDFIHKHTLFNYYTAFSSDEVKTLIKAKMKQYKGKAFKVTKYEDVYLNKYLRYCPKCVEEQLQGTGEFYWNRIHQVSFMCTKHQELLVDSAYETGGKDLTYHVPECNVISFKNKKDIIFFQKLLKISKRIEVLVTKGSNIKHKDLKVVYYKELDKRGFIYKSKQQVYIQELEEEILKYFGEEVIERVTGKRSLTWVGKLLGDYTEDVHPLYHVLMQAFLELDNKKIVGALQEVRQEQYYLEERGLETRDINPLLYKNLIHIVNLNITCKNPLAVHYQKEQVKDVILKYGDAKKDIMCTFKCSCGFTYTTAFKDLIKSGGEMISKIKEWGPIYEEELIKRKGLGIKGIARLTGINHVTIRKQLRNYESQGTIVSRYKKDEKKVIIPDEIYSKKRRDDYKVKWLQKDEMYYQKVKELVEQEKQSTDKPKWITKTYIGKQIGAQYAIVYNLDKLPKTKEIVESNVMSREKWVRKRLIWAIKIMLEEGEEIIVWKVIRKAGLANNSFKKLDNMVKEIMKEY